MPWSVRARWISRLAMGSAVVPEASNAGALAFSPSPDGFYLLQRLECALSRLNHRAIPHPHPAGLWKVIEVTGININAADAAFKAGVEAAGGAPAKYDWQEVNSKVFITLPPLIRSTARLYVVGVDPASGCVPA